MKKSFLLLTFAMVVYQANATIRRVNNNPGVVLVTGLVFADFNAALSAASSIVIDTIYLEPSDINYGTLTVNKKVVIVGAGYLLNKNPNTPFDKRTAKCSAISLISGANNVKIFGIEVRNNNGNYGDIFISTLSDIEITCCIFNDLRGSSSSSLTNALITNCFMLGSIRKINFTISQSTISNNIILGFVETNDADDIIKNNVIFGGIDSVSIYFNNIIYSTNVLNPLTLKPNIYNNVCVGCTGTPTNNNFFTTAPNTIFTVSEPRTLDDLEDDNFILAVSSPAKTKGVGGIDCGVFAGLKPYILSGIPSFPMITAFTQGAISGSNLPITFSIKRN